MSSAEMAVVVSFIYSKIIFLDQTDFFLSLLLQLEGRSSSMKDFRENSFISLYKTVPSEEYAVSLPYWNCLFYRDLLFTTSPV